MAPPYHKTKTSPADNPFPYLASKRTSKGRKGDVAKRQKAVKQVDNPYQGLYDEAADALADRVIEKHWAYYAGAGAAIAFGSGLMIGFLYLMSGQPLHLFMMPAWFIIMGLLLYFHFWAFKKGPRLRFYSLFALVAAMILWPISMAVVFAFVV